MPFVRSVQLLHDRVDDLEAWPFSLPAVRALREPLELDERVTILTGDNGAGKSTVIESLAVALGLNAEGGSNHMAFATRPSHSELHDALRIARTGKRPRTRYFLRSESLYNLASAVEQNVDAAGAHGGRSLHEQSHGESLLAVVLNRFGREGLYLLDEPEAGLSPHAMLALIVHLTELVEQGSQVIMATHAPLLLALPGARVLELGDHGIRPVDWQDTESVRLTRAFLEAPQRFLDALG